MTDSNDAPCSTATDGRREERPQEARPRNVTSANHPTDGRVTHRARSTDVDIEGGEGDDGNRGASIHRISIVFVPLPLLLELPLPTTAAAPPRPPLRFYHIMRGISLTRNGRKLPGCPLSLPPSFLPSFFAAARDCPASPRPTNLLEKANSSVCRGQREDSVGKIFGSSSRPLHSGSFEFCQTAKAD